MEVRTNSGSDQIIRQKRNNFNNSKNTFKATAHEFSEDENLNNTILNML